MLIVAGGAGGLWLGGTGGRIGSTKLTVSATYSDTGLVLNLIFGLLGTAGAMMAKGTAGEEERMSLGSCETVFGVGS